jgi:hypothetical protein
MSGFLLPEGPFHSNAFDVRPERTPEPIKTNHLGMILPPLRLCDSAVQIPAD